MAARREALERSVAAEQRGDVVAHALGREVRGGEVARGGGEALGPRGVGVHVGARTPWRRRLVARGTVATGAAPLAAGGIDCEAKGPAGYQLSVLANVSASIRELGTVAGAAVRADPGPRSGSPSVHNRIIGSRPCSEVTKLQRYKVTK